MKIKVAVCYHNDWYHYLKILPYVPNSRISLNNVRS